MPKPVVFTSNLTALIKAHKKIGAAAVEAAARFVTNQAKRNARGGFKSGDFVTTGWNTITYVLDKGSLLKAPKAYVGTRREHFAYWELGHHNVFTRRYERYEWLRPAMERKRVLQAQAAKKAAEGMARKLGVGVRLTGIPTGGGRSRGIPG